MFLCFALFGCDCGAQPVIPGECMVGTDCADGEVCVDNMCRMRTVDPECESDADCTEDGEICMAGICQAPDVMCIDPDGDGFGPGCPRGDDCDPDDPSQTGREVCDGRDNDCDGEADNGVLSPCGDCESSCEIGGIGGETTPFVPDEENSDGVGTDEDGALVLDSRRVNTNFIWIANTSEGTVSRFSTMAPYNEVGRYVTGPGPANDPSRTSVNSVGDAFVGNRRGTSLTRISVLGEDCPDTNGDGVITTSQDINGDGIIQRDGSGEMLAWGEDDCILWHNDLNDAMPTETLIRAVAAQDIEGPDGELLEYVWVGGYSSSTIAKLDASDGTVLLSTPAPRNPYGFALDGRGLLWVSSRAGSNMGFVDTNRCVDDDSCGGPICTASSSEAADCDDAIKASIPAPFVLYGVTVDFNQRVWFGGSGIARYDLEAAAGSRWSRPTLPFSGSIAIHGIAADASGFIWGAGQSNGVARVDAESLAVQVVTGTTGVRNKGMAVDAEGKIWSITQSNQAVVITPGATIDAATVETGVGASTLVGNYTYSDMTGLQLRLATNPRGFYRHIYEGCDPEMTAGGTTEWSELRFEAETPDGTTVSFRVRTAESREELEAAEWVSVGVAPPDTSPFDLAAILAGSGVTIGRYLMVEVVLTSERDSTREVISPRVFSVDATFLCPPDFG